LVNDIYTAKMRTYEMLCVTQLWKKVTSFTLRSITILFLLKQKSPLQTEAGHAFNKKIQLNTIILQG